LLKNELLGAGIEDVKDQQNEAINPQRSALLPKETRNLFQVTAKLNRLSIVLFIFSPPGMRTVFYNGLASL